LANGHRAGGVWLIQRVGDERADVIAHVAREHRIKRHNDRDAAR
jgi:hypothetical protein